MMKRKLCFTLLLLTAMEHVPAQSILKDKEEKDLAVMLKEVVVTGTGTEHYLKDAPVQTEVITRKALEQSGTQHRRTAERTITLAHLP